MDSSTKKQDGGGETTLNMTFDVAKDEKDEH